MVQVETMANHSMEHENYPAADDKSRIRELERENALLEEHLKEAEKANWSKSRFLSSMSHDIRTPMNAILGMTSIGLAHIDEKARVQDCLNKIRTASEHLMSLVNDVLDMSRIDSGRMSLNEEDFSLPDLIHDISVIVRAQAGQKRQTLTIGIGQIYEEYLSGDPLHLRQILVNIIGNAVKYTQEEGEIQVRFYQRLEEPRSETVQSEKESVPEAVQSGKESAAEIVPGEPGGGSGRLMLCFECRDNGIGMSADFLERIFEPFERVHNEFTKKIEGTGLGMSIVKNLVDRMDGQIRVESEEGAGSCFFVEIPLPAVPQSHRDLKLPKGQKVLIAEALTERADQIAGYLREAGLEPVTVAYGLKAVTMLTEAQYEKNMPCALLLGQKLADIPALEVAAHVRQLAGKEFPILLVSEEDWAQTEYRATRAGVNAFVPCPLFKSRLLKALLELVSSKTAEEAGAGGGVDFASRRVLLVEDIALNQEIAVELLSMIGVQVEAADDGARAVEMFAASPEHYYDVIFMDIHMPVMDGYEASRRIRRMDRQDAARVWIVAMTADAFVEDVRLAREAGMNEHISKPVDPKRLQEVLFRQFSQE
ncbi:MAG: response regulator [Roseburia sp.]|jgi:two-component system sensor histidine kinase/response regulator|nr:response regulator [Roseburia sp.]